MRRSPSPPLRAIHTAGKSGRPGTTAELNVDQARSKARETVRRIKAGLPPTEPPTPVPDSVVVVADNWLARVVDKEKHRTAGETRRIINKYIVPHIGGRVFAELRRSEIARLLDLIEDQHGARMADRTLATMRAIANWVQSRDDDYVSPFAVRGMRRSTNGARERILSDAEIREFWATTRITSTGAALRLLLLTGQRKSKILEMRWEDISPDGTWTISTAPREKGNPGALKLPKVAIDLIRKQPRLGERVFDFRETTLDDAKTAISGVWTIHDFTPDCPITAVARRRPVRARGACSWPRNWRCRGNLRPAPLRQREGARARKAGGADRENCQSARRERRRA